MVRSKHSYLALSILLILHFPFSYCSYLPQAVFSPFNRTESHNLNQMNDRMRYEIRLHGILQWASLGFLMPIGILVIRMSNKYKSKETLKFYFYFHLVLQILSVLVGTTGAIMSIKTFENSFNNKHQRIGLALYGAIWIQAVLGFLRPRWGARKRSIWYIIHWVFGTTICIVGILNIYLGLDAYKKKTKANTRLWEILFTFEIIFMAFLYLFQDKWEYLKTQRVSLGEVRPSFDQESSSMDDNVKDSSRQPYAKANALRNLFNRPPV